ncbi:MAG: radical SAM protein [Candidatus Sumerlaeaceae bacterium]
MPGKNVLLIEPGYKNKYPPLGLMKIAQYHGPQGKQDNVRFIKGCDRTVLEQSWDRIYVTTLFSFEWKRIAETIDFALLASGNSPQNVFVGGIAASLMHEAFTTEKRWAGVRIIKGLLNKAPAISLELDVFAEELYSEDTTSQPIEDLIPDYNILGQVDYPYAVHDAYFAYASRGCVRKCSFCGVPKLEGDLYDTPSLSAVVNGIEKLYGPKKDLILMDNNIVASSRFKEVMAEIRDLGFTRGAKLRRGRSQVLRRVDFNQGVDARILCKDPVFLRELATICTNPLRIAFDHLGFKRQYETSIRFAHEVGLNDLSNYMLYNFNDSPEDLYERMWLNIELNVELNIRIFSFPMRYQPTDSKERSYVGKRWNKYYLRSMQLILQATHGIVSGAPSFFRRAFGSTAEEFTTLLIKPHKFIFNRAWFEEHDGRPELDEYEALARKLSPSDRVDLLETLSKFEYNGLYNFARSTISNRRVAEIFELYKPINSKQEAEIREKQAKKQWDKMTAVAAVPDDQRVEDAGLELEPTLMAAEF